VREQQYANQELARPAVSGNGAMYLKNASRPPRRPWYARKRVLGFIIYLGAIAATIGILWLNIPVVNLLTGESETNGTKVKRTMQNLLQPQASLDVAFSGRPQICVLLLGLDHVPERGVDDPPHRSDAVLVAATDFNTKQIRILSIPRDGWVEHYQNGVEQGKDKLAHTFALGGIDRTKETVEHLMGLSTDFYVTIKFEGLAKVIDALGGLDVDVEKNMNYDDRGGDLHIHFKKGLQHLTGEQVVQYARFRHDAMSDIARMGRQQKVMQLLLAELMKPENLPRLGQIASILMGCVDTNLTMDQLLALAQHAKEFKPDDIKTLTLNSFCNMGKGHVDVPGAPRGMSVQLILEPDIAVARQFVTDLQPPPPPAPPAVEGASPVDGATEPGTPPASDSSTPAQPEGQ
jgi:polyisoprenyl-teichoic acid--peptidoglycan teichoic acid transferase